MDFMTNVMRAIKIRRPVVGKFTVDVSTANSRVENLKDMVISNALSTEMKKKKLD